MTTINCSFVVLWYDMTIINCSFVVLWYDMTIINCGFVVLWYDMTIINYNLWYYDKIWQLLTIICGIMIRYDNY